MTPSKLIEVGPPDIETASDAYAGRFRGPVGAFLLQVQREKLFSLLGETRSLRVLEVGGGHGQLTEALLDAGHEVVVHGSTSDALVRVESLKRRFVERLGTVVSEIEHIPVADQSFDVVIAIRLLPHMENWPEVVREMMRISKTMIVFDYAPAGSFNVLYPLLFKIKKKVERNTRTFLRFSAKEVEQTLAANGWKAAGERRQFFLPMVFHRWAKSPAISLKLERFFDALGLTQLLGSPALVAARKQ